MEHICYEDFEKLMAVYGNIERIWKASTVVRAFEGMGLKQKVIDELRLADYKVGLEKYVKYMEKNDIKMITCYDEKYPYKLHIIKNKPIVLFYRGCIDIVNHESVAIVGSRNCSQYGRKVAELIGGELAAKGVNVVSGLASGIDSAAHVACLRSKGLTVAVIGNGLDTIYPSQNQRLAEKIIERGGVIISEYVVGTKPERRNFPRRNRLISGISDAVVIVEASKKSGSLITANMAINQGKEVWAVPGSIFSECSEGTNELIRDGANVFTCINDIIR